MMILKQHSYTKKKLPNFFLVLAYFTCVGCFFSKARAQTTSNSKDFNLGYQAQGATSSFNVIILSGIAQKAVVEKQMGDYDMKSTLQPCWEAGGDYQYSLSKSRFLITGLHLHVNGRNATFRVPVEKINPDIYKAPYPITKFSDFDIGLSVPVFLQKEWTAGLNRRIYVLSGVQIHYSFETDIEYNDDYIDSSGSFIDVFDLSLNTNNHQKPWFTYTLGACYEWTLKNDNFLKIGLTGDLSFFSYVKGNYSIKIPNEIITSGSYEVRGSNVCVSVSYGFTGTNRKMVNKHEG